MAHSQKGYWADHNYKRHSVDEIEEFIGWENLIKLIEKGNNLRNRALPAALFSTGTRISEGLQLRLSHFDLTDKEIVRCIKVPIVKQKKIYNKFRTFSFPRDEPAWHYVEEHIVKLKSRIRIRNKDPLLFQIKRVQSYNIVKDLGKQCKLEIWNHWFRSQRASQIGYEYDFTENELMEWFKVIDPTWARKYCKKGDKGLRKRMFENKPKEWI